MPDDRMPMLLKKRILIVDDEENMLTILEARLKHAGFDVDCARNGIEAVERACKKPPQLVILDIMMPGADGFEVIAKLRNDKRTKTVPIMMLTSRSEKSDIQKALTLGANDFMSKPFAPNILLDKVKRNLKVR